MNCVKFLTHFFPCFFKFLHHFDTKRGKSNKKEGENNNINIPQVLEHVENLSYSEKNAEKTCFDQRMWGTAPVRWSKYTTNTIKSPDYFRDHLIAGGLNSTENYDFLQDIWTSGPLLPTLRSEGRRATVNNRYFWFGGRAGLTKVTGTPTILEYNPISGWATSAMVLTTSSSFPVVLPYNF